MEFTDIFRRMGMKFRTDSEVGRTYNPDSNQPPEAQQQPIQPAGPDQWPNVPLKPFGQKDSSHK